MEKHLPHDVQSSTEVSSEASSAEMSKTAGCAATVLSRLVLGSPFHNRVFVLFTSLFMKWTGYLTRLVVGYQATQSACCLCATSVPTRTPWNTFKDPQYSLKHSCN